MKFRISPSLRAIITLALIALTLTTPWQQVLRAQTSDGVYLPLIAKAWTGPTRDPQFRLVNYSVNWAQQNGAAATYTLDSEVLYFSRYTPGARYTLNATRNGASFPVLSPSLAGLSVVFEGGDALGTFEVPISIASADKATVLPQPNGDVLVVLPAAEPSQAQAIVIPAGAFLGTTVLTAGMGAVLVPVGVGLVIVGGFAYVMYMVYQADQADIGQPVQNLLPTTGLSAAQAIAEHSRWMAQLESDTPEEFLGPIESAQTDAGQPGDPDPCKWFPNHGGQFPQGWTVRVPKKLADDVVVEIVDGTGNVVTRAEASATMIEGRLTGQVGVVTKAAFRRQNFGTVAANIASDVLVEVNQNLTGDVISQFILNDEAKLGANAWKCRTAGANVRFLNEFARIFDYVSFRGTAMRLGIPPY